MADKEKTETAKTETKPKKATVVVREGTPKRDIFYVQNAKPDRVYYHTAKDPMRVQEMENAGWVVCRDEEVLPSKAALEGGVGTETRNLPGHILMWTTKENWEKIKKMQDARLHAHEQDIKDKVDQVKALLDRTGLGRARSRLKDDEIQF